MFYLYLTLILLVCYLIGSIPFGLLVAKSKGIDIRKEGSGNIGATNVFRIIGKKFGILVFFLDFLKGVFSVILMRFFLTKYFPIDEITFSVFLVTISVKIYLFSALFFAVIGHNYSIWLSFSGGKGIATSAGAVCIIMPLIFLICLIVWIVSLLLFRMVSLASILAAISVPISISLILLYKTMFNLGNFYLLLLSLVIAFLACWRHKENIKRIYLGTEYKF